MNKYVLLASTDAIYKMPFLQGNNDFTKKNHVDFKLGLELSPVTIAPVASVTISPITFLEFAIGGTVGSGWNIGSLFQGMSKYNEYYQSSDFGKYASSYKGDFMTIDIWPTAEITLGKKTSSMSLPISSHAAVFAKNTTILSMNR